jgi:hypothetical protein
MASNYYKGAYRFMRDGVPCKVAVWVKDLSTISRNDMLRGYDVKGLSRETRECLAAERWPQTTYLPLED